MHRKIDRRTGLGSREAEKADCDCLVMASSGERSDLDPPVPNFRELDLNGDLSSG
jgi:hypothetical protein